MALINSAFSVNVTPGAMPPIVHVSEYDVGRTYTVTINGQNGSAFNIPTGTTATVEGTLNGVIGFTTGATISGSTVSFTLTESMTARSGKAWCKIKLTLNNEPIQTCAFVLAVDRAGVEAETVIGADGFDTIIQNAVDNYLEDHPIVIDPTLSVSGAAADAKVTGDKIGDLKSHFDSLKTETGENNKGTVTLYQYSNFVIGGMTSGQFTPHNKRVMSQTSMVFPNDLIVRIANGYRAGFHTLDAGGTFISDSGWKTGTWYIPANTHFKVVISKPSEENVTNIYEYVSALTIQGVQETVVGNAVQNKSINIPTTLSEALWQPITGITALENLWVKITDNVDAISYYRIYTSASTNLARCYPNKWYKVPTLRNGIYQLQFPVDCVINGGEINLYWYPESFEAIDGNAIINGSISSLKLDSLLAQRTMKPRKNWLTSSHRGVFNPQYSQSPLAENTLGAFYNAYLSGADLIETDARESSDGVIVCCHDASITVNGTTYVIAETSSEVLTALVLSTDPIYGAQTMPTLEDVLTLAYNTGLAVNVDVKTPSLSSAAIAELVRKSGMRGKVFYALNGGGLSAINSILQYDPDARFVETLSRAMPLSSDIQANKFYCYSSTYSAAVVDEIRSYGFAVILSEVSDIAKFEQAVVLKPEMIEFSLGCDPRPIEDKWFQNRLLT